MKIMIKPNKKVLLLVVVAILLVVATVFTTLAWLTSQTETVTNTFTYGKVEITMDETKVTEYGEADPGASERVTENTYKLIPGHTYLKDPTIHVDADSEECYIFVKIDNQLGNAASFQLTDLQAAYSTTDAAVPWQKYDTQSVGNVSVYYFPTAVLPGAEIEVFSEFTFSSAVSDMSPYVDKKIILTAYAIQAEGFTGDDGQIQVDSAWGALNPLT